MLKTIKNSKIGKLKSEKKLGKTGGDEKLVITLVLIAVGVGLCIIYRNSIWSTMNSALTTLNTNITNLLAGTVSK